MKILTDRAPRAHHRDGGDIVGIGGRVVATTGNAAVILGAGIATVLRSESCRRDHAGPPCVASGGGRERQRGYACPVVTAPAGQAYPPPLLPFGADLFPFVRSSRCPPWAAACQRRHPAPLARQPAAASEQAAGRTRGPAPTQPRPQLAPRRCAPRPRRTDDPPSDIGRQLYTIDAAAPGTTHAAPLRGAASPRRRSASCSTPRALHGRRRRASGPNTSQRHCAPPIRRTRPPIMTAHPNVWAQYPCRNQPLICAAMGPPPPQASAPVPIAHGPRPSPSAHFTPVAAPTHRHLGRLT